MIDNEIAKKLTGLSPQEKRVLLARLLQEEPQVLKRAPSSFAQQRLWFMDQWESGNPHYNISTAVRLNGLLEVVILERSLKEVVRRHEALRTIFVEVDGQPMQVIVPVSRVSLPIVDLQALPEAKREMEVRRLALERARWSFDLARGPLMLATVLRLREQEHVLLLTMHHIVSDGWSVGVLIQEMATLYEAFSSGEPSPLPELAIQYADYAVWQREWLQGDVLEKQLAYWRAQLCDVPAVVDLPMDRARPPVQTFRGTTEYFTLPNRLTAALKRLSWDEGNTLFMTLLATFKVLLYRYTGQRDIVVGTPIASRNRTEIEELIGFFVNTLVLRTELSGNLTFQELLGQVREMTLGAYAHQDLPFGMLVEKLQPKRDLSRSPLFQVMFVLQNAPMSLQIASGLTLSRLEVESQTAQFDLTLSMIETEQGLNGILVYNTDLFDKSTMTQLVGHFWTLLESIVADPKQRLSDLSLLTDAERYRILVEWNDTQAEYLKDRCIHELFEEQVEQTPDAVAVVFQDQHLSYRELNQRANQLAHHLQALGVGPETLVGLCVERSVEMVVGILGTLKTGGAYVPLDPTYPQERLAFILRDTQTAVLLTQERLGEALPEHRAQAICLGADWGTIARESGDNPISGVMADNLAYAIYTSGSTGWPKGVLLAHRGLCNVSEAQLQTFQLGPNDRVLQFASLSFDASTFEILLALRTGATLCLGTRESLLPGPPLAQLLQDLAVTIATLTPATLALLPVEELPTLQTINVAGEACPAELVARWVEGRRFFNLYGPTEGTIWTTAAACTVSDEKPPIGGPIANTKVYVLDPHRQPVPVGVPGELCISGVGLARGYLNRPGLTAETFIPNPFSKEPGTRLYRTGDLTRYLTDGNIEFLGRIDYQVKVRGFRIELGEIETVLKQQPGVREAVVLARDDTLGDGRASSWDKHLVAYVVPDHAPVSTFDELRGFLQDKLPEYMLPSVFVTLEALPLTPSGKVDWRALPAPERRRPEEKTFVPPTTSIEKELAMIWAKVLKLEQIGVHDDFFELGGHSLLATQIVSRVREVFQVELSLQRLFETPTVAGLAQAVDDSLRHETPAVVAAITSEAFEEGEL